VKRVPLFLDSDVSSAVPRFMRSTLLIVSSPQFQRGQDDRCPVFDDCDEGTDDRREVSEH